MNVRIGFSGLIESLNKKGLKISSFEIIPTETTQ